MPKKPEIKADKMAAKESEVMNTLKALKNEAIKYQALVNFDIRLALRLGHAAEVLRSRDREKLEKSADS